MRNTVFILMLFIVGIKPVVFAQDSTCFQQPKYNFHQFWHETGTFIKQPIYWKARNYIELGAVLAGSFLLLEYVDAPVRDAVERDNRYAFSLPMDAGREWGGFFVSPLTVIGLGIHGWTTNNQTSKKLCYEIAQAVVYSEAIHFVVKMCVGRSRPYSDASPYDYTPFKIPGNANSSFPAGHVVNAMSFSTVLSKNAKNKVLKVLAYVPAALCMAARIYQNNHWSSDVFFSAAVGYFVGNWVVNFHEAKGSRVEISSIYPLGIKIGLN